MLLSQEGLKRVMDKVGIDVICFKPHSTSTSTSSNAKGAPLSAIMNTAGWTQNSTFRKFMTNLYREVLFPNCNLGQLIMIR